MQDLLLLVLPIAILTAISVWVFRNKKAENESVGGNIFGWLIANFFLYAVPKALLVIVFMSFTDQGVVFPATQDLRVHVPSAVIATILIGLIYLRCWYKIAKKGENNV